MKKLVLRGKMALLSMMALSMMLLMSTPGAQAQGTRSNESILVAFSMVSCTGEVVLIEGRFHSVINRTQDQSGGFHLTEHNNHNLQAVSPDGARYTVTSANASRFNVDDDSAINSTYTANFHLIRHGENGTPDDFVIHANLHVTQNANGELTATPTNAYSECR